MYGIEVRRHGFIFLCHNLAFLFRSGISLEGIDGLR
jgi:hypothetical protein